MMWLSAAALLVLSPAAGLAEEPYETAGRKFWKGLAEADFAVMEAGYAPEVTLLAGSELLKKQWGINPSGDRSKNLAVKREVLLKGYHSLLDGRTEKWKEIMSKIGKDKITFQTVDKDDKPIPGVRTGDVLMKVATGPGDDVLAFILRRSDKEWLVAMEATDY
jgi:hypothetical protein